VEQQPGQRALSQPQQEQPEQPEQQHRFSGGVCRTSFLRYVDDFALFADSRRQLWSWKAAIIERLARISHAG